MIEEKQQAESAQEPTTFEHFQEHGWTLKQVEKTWIYFDKEWIQRAIEQGLIK